MRSHFIVLTILVGLISAYGCGGGSGSGNQLTNPPEIVVTVTGAPDSTAVGTSFDLQASVANDSSNKGVRWAISPATGSGTLSSAAPFSVTYNAPAALPAQSAVTITATSVASPSRLGSATFKLTAPVSAVIRVTIPAAVRFSSVFSSIFSSDLGTYITANVENDPENLGVTFSLTVGGTVCTPACGQLVPVGLTKAFYAPPYVAPIGASDAPTITATSVADSTKSDSFSFTIQNPFGGQYSFLLTGFDGAGNPLAIVGSVNADGNGNITGGSLDLNDNQTHITFGGPLTGTYTLGTALQLLTLTNITLPNSGINPVFAFTIDAEGQLGDIIEFDSSGILAAGVIQKQDPTALNLATLAGDFAFELDSNLPVRNSALGRFTLAADGSISNGLVDRSVAGAGAVFSGQLLGGPLAQPDAQGRGTLSLTPVGGSAQNYVFYVVSPQTLMFMQTDASNISAQLQAGLVLRQQTPFTTAMVNGTGVFGLTGVVPGTSQPSLAIGVLTTSGFTGPGTGSASAIYDAYQGGIPESNPGLSASAISFDPGTGRGTFTFPNGFSSDFMDSIVFYLTNSGQGFFLDNDVGANNQALAGAMQTQSGGPFDALYSLTFGLQGIGGGSTSPAIPSVVTEMAPLAPYFGFVPDITTQSAGPVSPGEINTTYGPVDKNSGRGAAVVPGAFFVTTNPTVNCVFYLAGPDKFVLIPTDPDVVSGVMVFSVYLLPPGGPLFGNP